MFPISNLEISKAHVMIRMRIMRIMRIMIAFSTCSTQLMAMKHDPISTLSDPLPPKKKMSVPGVGRQVGRTWAQQLTGQADQAEVKVFEVGCGLVFLTVNLLDIRYKSHIYIYIYIIHCIHAICPWKTSSR